MDCLNHINHLMSDAVYSMHQARRYGFKKCNTDDADYLFDLHEVYKAALELSQEDLSLCKTCDELGEIINTL